MEEVKIKVYTLEELSDEVQQKVIDDHRDINIDHYWYQVIDWEKQDELKEKGYKNPSIDFTGFGSQGDGACFTATLDLAKFEDLAPFAGRVSVALERASTIHAHEHMVNIDWDTDEKLSAEETNRLDEACQKVLEQARVEMRAIYRALQNEYEYRTEDDAVRETIIESEYRFTADGKRFET